MHAAGPDSMDFDWGGLSPGALHPDDGSSGGHFGDFGDDDHLFWDVLAPRQVQAETASIVHFSIRALGSTLQQETSLSNPHA